MLHISLQNLLIYLGINPLKMSASNDSLVVTGDAFNDTQWSNVTVFRVEIPTGVISGEGVYGVF